VENNAANFLRRLVPFPGTEVVTPLSLLRVSPAGGGTLQDQVANVGPASVTQQASAIVSQAASVLDEEMARGVLAARQANPSYRAPTASVSSWAPAADPGSLLLRQVHDVVDQVAAAWPNLQGVPNQRLGRSQPVASDVDPLAELRPPATVRAGQRATISMAVCNSENRSVRLVPAATDLLGSRGGRIACSLLEFTPMEFKLEPQEKMDVAIALTVPTETAPGCYFGLFVVRGVDYLRALITIEVV
jgi:hypothetical protein